MFIIQPDFLVILTYYNPIEVRYSAGFVRFFQDYTESIDAVGRALKVLKAQAATVPIFVGLGGWAQLSMMIMV